MAGMLARLTVLLLCFATPAAAASSPASDMIRTMADKAIETLSAKDGDLATREDRLQAVLVQYFDMPYIAQFTLGRYWRRLSDTQRQDYVAAFSDYVLATYSRRLGGYAGETFAVTSEREAGPDDVIVSSQISRPSGAPILADWRVRVADDQPKIIDVAVEGVSMAVTQRSEFASVVRQNGVDGLIQVLQARAGRSGAKP